MPAVDQPLAPAPRSSGPWTRLRVHDGREILALALPTVMTMLSHTLMWTVDTALLGRVDSVALAAAGLGGILTWTAYCLVNNLSRITGTFVSQAWGRGDEGDVARYTWQGIWIALATGLLLTAMGWSSAAVLPWTRNPPDVLALTYDYIRLRSLSAVATQLTFVLMGFFVGRRQVRVPMVAGIAGNVVNVLLDLVLIFGWSGVTLAGRTWLATPPLGVAGAAMATSIGAGVNALVLVIWALTPRLRARYALHRVRRPEFAAIRRVIRVGAPAAWENFMDMGGFLMFTVFVGTTGAVPLAASQITLQVLSFSFMPLWGLTTAAGVLVGNAIGRGEPDRAAHFGRQVYKLGSYYSLALACAMLLGRGLLFRIFTADPAVLALGAGLVAVAAVFQYFDGLRMLSSGILQGAGDTRYTMLVTLLLMWGGFIPLTWYLIVPRGGDVQTAWLGATVCYLAQGLLMWRRFQSGAWRHIDIFR